MLNSTNLIGLASADSSGPIYMSDDVYVGVFGGPGTTTVNLPAGTRSVVFTTAPTSKANMNVTSITLGGVAATMLAQTHQTQEYYKGTGVWAVNYAGSGPTTMSFTCGSGAVIMVFALKRQFVTVGADDSGIDVGCGNVVFQAYMDTYKDGLAVCAWRSFAGGASIGSPFTSFYAQHTSWNHGPLVSAITVPTTTEYNKLIQAYTQGDFNYNCDDGATMTVVSFKADRFI